RDRRHGTPPVSRLLAGNPLSAPAGSFRMLPNIRAAMAGTTPGLRLDGLIGPISIPRRLQFSPGPRRDIPVPCGLDPGAATVCYQPSGRVKYCRSSMPPLIRKATAEDTARIRAIARAGYAKYVPRIGREPAPMVADFAAEVAAGHVVVIGTAGAVDGYMIAWPETDAYLIDNIA